MSVAESKTNALFDQGFVQTGVMLRKEDKACIVTDMGRVEWFQVNPWGGVQALSAAPEAIAKLRHLYQNMVNGAVRDTASAKRIAEGLLAPAIEALERATPPAEQQVIIDFAQVGTAGPFHVVNGRVKLPDATIQDLARMLRPTYEAEQAAPKAAPNLPERNASLPAERQGLFRKFVVGRVDGSDKPGGKHYGCTYFVLDVDHDPCARPALAAYAAACESTHPTLAADLRTKWGAVPSPQPAPAPLSDDTALLDGLARLNWYVGPGDFYCDEAGGMNDYDDKNYGPEELRQAIRAALAAQGGK